MPLHELPRNCNHLVFAQMSNTIHQKKQQLADTIVELRKTLTKIARLTDEDGTARWLFHPNESLANRIRSVHALANPHAGQCETAEDLRSEYEPASDYSDGWNR